MLVEKKDPAAGQQARERLTIDGIKERRARAGKLYAPTASYSDSDMFKSPVRKLALFRLIPSYISRFSRTTTSLTRIMYATI